MDSAAAAAAAVVLPIDYDLLMDSGLYEALVEGNEEDIADAVWQKMEQHGSRQVTPKGNTVLHIAALYGHIHFVDKILLQEHHRSSLLCAQNKKGETALHIAAREGHTHVVSALIHCAKTYPEVLLESGMGIGARDMVRMVDEDKDTALHKAVRNGHLEVVKLLVKEDPEFEFPANLTGETPLYIAAEVGFHDGLVEMLNNCHRPVYGGPLGRNALHAAIINWAPKDCTKLLLVNEACLCEVGDDEGWTPLHYAVRLNNEKAVCDILQVKSSAAYIPAGRGKEWTTAIHIAVRKNFVGLFKKIVERCPLCWEMVNSKAQNVLHEAILNNSTEIIKYILNNNNNNCGPKRDHLLDEKDEDGNTPLHLLAASHNYVPEFKKHPRLLKNAGVVFNKQHMTPLDIAYQQPRSASVFLQYGPTKVGNQHGGLTMNDTCNNNNGEEERRRKRMEMIARNKERYINSVTKTANTNIVVATLIATVTFAAGITLPGGYRNNENQEGMPILLRKPAFKAFVVTDAIGFVCSIASIIGYILLVEEMSSSTRLEIVEKLDYYSLVVLDLSLAAVVLAFVMGMFAVLTLHSSAVAVGVCVAICLCIIALIAFPMFLSYHQDWWIVTAFQGILQFFNKLCLQIKRRNSFTQAY